MASTKVGAGGCKSGDNALNERVADTHGVFSAKPRAQILSRPGRGVGVDLPHRNAPQPPKHFAQKKLRDSFDL